MGKKREHKTMEQLRQQVAEEIPYVVGQGQKCTQARTRRLKELFRRHGYPTHTPSGLAGIGLEGGGQNKVSAEPGDNKRLSTKRTRAIRGQRVA